MLKKYKDHAPSTYSTKQWLTLGAGHFFVFLGVMGAVLPIMPTVPFLLLAAYFYNKGHPKFHQKLLGLPQVGPVLKDWDEHKIIRRKAKWGATFMILVVFSWPIYFGRNNLAVTIALIAAILILVTFIQTRKSK